MAREYRASKETGQADFENTGFDNSGFGDSRNQGRNRFSQDYKRKEDSPKKQGGFENSSFDNSAFGGIAGRGDFQDRQQSRPSPDRSGGNRPQQNRYGGGDRSHDAGKKIMAKEYRTAKETEQAGFDNAGFGDSRNQSRNRSSQNWKRKEDSPKKQGGFENTSFDNSACGGSAGRGNFRDRQQSRPTLDRSGGNRPQHNRYGAGDRLPVSEDASGGVIRQSFGSSFQKRERDYDQKGDNRFRNRLYSISPERNQSSGKSGGSAGRFSNTRADNGQSSSSRNTPSFNDSGYRASYDRNASKFSSSGQKRSVDSISRYCDGHDNRTCSPERKQTRQEGAEPSDNPWVHDKFKPSQGSGKKPNTQECEGIEENIQFGLEEIF